MRDRDPRTGLLLLVLCAVVTLGLYALLAWGLLGGARGYFDRMHDAKQRGLQAAVEAAQGRELQAVAGGVHAVDFVCLAGGSRGKSSSPCFPKGAQA